MGLQIAGQKLGPMQSGFEAEMILIIGLATNQGLAPRHCSKPRQGALSDWLATSPRLLGVQQIVGRSEKLNNLSV